MLLTNEEKEKLASENSELVYFVAEVSSNSEAEIAMLIGPSTMGFIKALNRFDKSKNSSFSAFALNCMRNEILYFLQNKKNNKEEKSKNRFEFMKE